MNEQYQKGVGLIEIIIAVSIISATFLGVLQITTLALKATGERNERARALAYAQEAIEAVRNIRDGGWTDNIAVLTFGGTYYITTSGNAWALTQTNPGLLDGKFTRTVVLDNVSRDINDNIVSSGGTNDASTKRMTTTVSWGNPTKTVQLVMYLMNIVRN